MMEKMICCDWGTTSLRLSVYTNETDGPVASIESTQGILAVNQLFLASPQDQSRREFFAEVLKKELLRLDSLIQPHTPIIISGMASANIGMEPLPYAPIPFNLEGTNAIIRSFVEGGRTFHLISGCSTSSDIMRGEETQVAGIGNLLGPEQLKDALVILPGTHSKHAVINKGSMTAFKTYMTGEVFCLLFTKSILAQSVIPNDFSAPGCMEAFLEGVVKGSNSNILQSIFDVRIRSMFHQADSKLNFAYLSGQLIGTELKDISPKQFNNIVVCGADNMVTAYLAALEKMFPDGGKIRLTGVSAAKATAAGQLLMYKSHRLYNFTP